MKKQITKKMTILDFMLNNLNHGAVLCRVNRTHRQNTTFKNSDLQFTNTLSQIIGSADGKRPEPTRKIDLEVIKITNDFFKKFPFKEKCEDAFNFNLKKFNY